MDLLTIGDSSIDLFMKIAEDVTMTASDRRGYPEICFYHGSKIPVQHYNTSIAGNALNIAVGGQHLGLETAIYTELGNDENGRRIVKELREQSINTSHCVLNDNSPTNVHAVIVYNADRTIFSYHEKRTYKILNWEKPKWIYYTSLGPGFEDFQPKLIEYLGKNPDIGFAFNPGTIQLRSGVGAIINILKLTDVLFVNREEAIRLTQDPGYSYEDLHTKLQMLGPKLTVITDGTNGANTYDGMNLIKMGVYTDARPIVDKTGAGDAFASAFIAALFYKKPLKEALSWGIVNSGACIKEIGAIHGLLNKDSLEKIVKSLKDQG